MATGRLTEIIKARRESGEGITSSLAGGLKERLKEKFDPRRIFNQNGILTALFPKLRAYKSNLPSQQPSGDVLNQPVPSIDGLSATNPLFQSININTKIIAKNSMVLPLIQKDTNLMKQTLKKIVKAMQVKKKLVPATRTRPVPVKNVPSTAPKGLETEGEQPEKDKGPLALLAAMIMETFNEIRKSITKTLTELPGKIKSGIVDGIKGLFTATKIASSVLLSILRPLLGLIFSPAGFALLLAAGIFYSIFKLSKGLSKKIAEEVPDMNIMSPQQASAVLENATEKDLIATASRAARRTEPFTLEEAVNYLEDQVKNGKKYAEEGLKDVEEIKRLDKILKSGDKQKIEAEGGVDEIKSKISTLKIKIANLGGEGKLKEIIKEKDATVPALLGRRYVENQIPNNIDADDAAAGASMKGMSSTPTNIINLDGSNTSSTTPSAITGSTDTMNYSQDGPGTSSTTPSITPSSTPGEINLSLTNSATDTQDGPGNSPEIVSTPKPIRNMSIDKNDIELAQILNDVNEYLSNERLSNIDVDSRVFRDYMNDKQGTDSGMMRITSALNDGHPDIVKALKLKIYDINSMMAF